MFGWTIALNYWTDDWFKLPIQKQAKKKKKSLLTISLIFTILQTKNENTFGRLFKRVGFIELPRNSNLQLVAGVRQTNPCCAAKMTRTHLSPLISFQTAKNSSQRHALTHAFKSTDARSRPRFHSSSFRCLIWLWALSSCFLSIYSNLSCRACIA